MTTPAPKVHNPDAVLEAVEDYGTCALVTDSRRRNDEVICGAVGVAEVLVRNQFGLYAVILCRTHKEQHRNFYSKIRGLENRKRRPDVN